jgi:hypothetical protein
MSQHKKTYFLKMLNYTCWQHGWRQATAPAPANPVANF